MEESVKLNLIWEKEKNLLKMGVRSKMGKYKDTIEDIERMIKNRYPKDESDYQDLFIDIQGIVDKCENWSKK